MQCMSGIRVSSIEVCMNYKEHVKCRLIVKSGVHVKFTVDVK